ncbi:GWxTD domain-containing protein [Pontibacter sp. G13]|uniref:GWxTD domain-containing protein n=1 Tax=Pontibacter sp. G13 TaxID=3074898 RepID=UPI00288A51C0|nr:GWxTD domain-containing protein [Pontibacter sp. G13]WNJ18080.1 GWxTD domain-containing protein [Pontibacter sp. G13]
MSLSTFRIPFWTILGSLLMMSIPQSLRADWVMDVRNYSLGENNVYIFLSYDGEVALPKTFQATLVFKQPVGPSVRATRYRTYLQKEMTLSTEGSGFFQLGFILPEGEYKVEVELMDVATGKMELLEQGKTFTVDQSREVKTSDIFLSFHGNAKQAFKEPILVSQLPQSDQVLSMYLRIKAPSYDQLTIRATLGIRQDDGAEIQSETVEVFESIHQRNRVVKLQPKAWVVFQDSIDLKGLERGDYLIKILLYNDDNVVAVKESRFRIGGRVQTRIFRDLDTSIRMMQYVAPADELEQILQLGDSMVKRMEFVRAWEKLFRDDPTSQMESYYEKVFEADARFAEKRTPGWLTDRGKVFIQFGEPRIRSVEIEGKTFERWTYVQWSLSFLFENRNHEYVLVE